MVLCWHTRATSKQFQPLDIFLVLFWIVLPSTTLGKTNIHIHESLKSLAQLESHQNALSEFEGTISVVEKKSAADESVIVTHARVATHPHFDRIVFTFAGEKLPGYRIEYATQPIEECGSGEIVRGLSLTYMLVRLSPSQAHREDGKITVERTARFAHQSLKQFRVTCDYEGDVEIVLGVAERVPYRVTELTKPLRLVIDVKHSPRR